jgi:hypothetical protein
VGQGTTLHALTAGKWYALPNVFLHLIQSQHVITFTATNGVATDYEFAIIFFTYSKSSTLKVKYKMFVIKRSIMLFTLKVLKFSYDYFY